MKCGNVLLYIPQIIWFVVDLRIRYWKKWAQ